LSVTFRPGLCIQLLPFSPRRQDRLKIILFMPAPLQNLPVPSYVVDKLLAASPLCGLSPSPANIVENSVIGEIVLERGHSFATKKMTGTSTCSLTLSSAAIHTKFQ
jgi:hypothetical protein